MNFTVGDWVRWTTPTQVKDGRVVRASGPSLEVEWLGGDRQVFPVTEGYYPPYGGGEHRLDHIPRPPKASVIERDIARDHMGIARAAATLGTTPKRVRAMLRAGQLQGTQEGGRWTSVDAGSVKRLSR